MNVVPLRLESIFLPRIWGAHSLAPLFPDKTSLADPIGEVWLTGEDCCVASGPYAGQTLREAWSAMGPEWTGSAIPRGARFPLLVKFIFPEDILSIQVHPDDEYAAQHDAASGWPGKTEMWYAVEARPGAEVLVGLHAGITRESFRDAIVSGSAEGCLERVPVKAGDAIYVPAGTVHTIGPGSVLCEIQEHSDLTYRVFDYNRRTPEGKPRPLHIEKAMDVIRFGEQGGGKIEPARIESAGLRETYFVACRYFATERWEFTGRIGAVTDRSRFELLVFLKGSGHIESRGESAAYAPAQAWLLPASLGAYRLAASSPTTLLRTYVPDLEAFARRLRDRGVPEASWSRLVYP